MTIAGYEAIEMHQQWELTNPYKTFSVPIMAGFLGGTKTEAERSSINEKLDYLWENEACTYTKTYADGVEAKLMWRCSLVEPMNKLHKIEAIDFSTFITGYAMNYLPDNFFHTYGTSTGPEDDVIPTRPPTQD